MSESYTQFSFEIKNITDQEAKWITNCMNLDSNSLKRWVPEGITDNEESWPDFNIELEEGKSSKTLWIHADDYGNPDHAAEFVMEFLKVNRPNETVCFEVAHTCSKPYLNAFGGMVYVVMATSYDAMDTYELCKLLKDKSSEIAKLRADRSN